MAYGATPNFGDPRGRLSDGKLLTGQTIANLDVRSAKRDFGSFVKKLQKHQNFIDTYQAASA